MKATANPGIFDEPLYAGPPVDPLEPPKYVTIRGEDLRKGDWLNGELSDASPRILREYYQCEVTEQDGNLGYITSNWGSDPRFKSFGKLAGRWFQVREPRPEPPSNEFGPVSP